MTSAEISSTVTTAIAIPTLTLATGSTVVGMKFVTMEIVSRRTPAMVCLAVETSTATKGGVSQWTLAVTSSATTTNTASAQMESATPKINVMV